MGEGRLSGLELLQGQVRRRRRVERVMAVIGVACLLALTVFWYLGAKRSVDGEPVAIKTMAELSRITGLTFPAGAVLKEGIYRRGWHYKIVAVVTMPRAAAPGFLAQPHLGTSQGASADSEGARALLADLREGQGEVSSWNIGTVHNFLIARWEISRLPKPYTAGVGSVLVSLDDPRQARVYLCSWGD